VLWGCFSTQVWARCAAEPAPAMGYPLALRSLPRSLQLYKNELVDATVASEQLRVSTVPSSRSTRRAATVTLQSLVGGFFWAAWVLLSLMLFDDELIRVATASLPYFVAFELGVFSRYLPGLRSAAKRFE